MKVDWSGNPEHLQAVKSALQVEYPGTPTYWLGVVGDDGTLVGVMVYHNFSLCSCEISCITLGAKPFTRSVLRELFAYPFHQLGLKSIYSIVSVNNERSLDLTRRIGLSVAGLLRNWYPDDSDGILHQMLKEECKWLK